MNNRGGFGAALHATKKKETTTVRTPSRHGSSIPKKAAGKDLRGQYGLTFQASFAAALLVVVGLLRIPFQAEQEFEITMATQETVQMEEIQQTNQAELPPPPPRPSVPIAVADETVLEEETLDLDAGLDLDEALALPAPPPPPKEEVKTERVDENEIFVVVEQMPEIVGGAATLYKLIQYPDIARKAGLEGMVVVQVVVEPNGKPSNPTVARSAGDVLDQAAVEAVMKLDFKPGKQRGQAVRVNYAIPVRFRLRDAT